jgi:hypothetical protein
MWTTPDATQLAGVNAPAARTAASSMTPTAPQNGGTAVACGIASRSSMPAAQKRKMRSPDPAAPAGNMKNSLCKP